MKVPVGCFPTPDCKLKLRGITALDENNLGLSVCHKGCGSKAFVKTIRCFHRSMQVEHMEALRKKGCSIQRPGADEKVRLQMRIPPRMWSWGTSARFTDEFFKSSRGHHLLPVCSIN